MVHSSHSLLARSNTGVDPLPNRLARPSSIPLVGHRCQRRTWNSLGYRDSTGTFVAKTDSPLVGPND